MKQLKLSLVIATYKAPKALEKILNQLLASKVKPLEIIVAEDGEDKETLRVVNAARAKKNVPIIHVRHKDDGYRRALIINKAVLQAKGEYLVFLDGDCVPHEKFIEDHMKLAELGCWVQGRRAFIEQEAVNDYLQGESLLKLFFRGQLKGVLKGIRLPFALVKKDLGEYGVLGCNMGIWRGDFVGSNGYNTAYVGWGREDSDLALRLYYRGQVRKFVYGHAIVYHLNHPEISRENLTENDRLLAEVKANRSIWCKQGLTTISESGDLGEVIR